MYIAVGRIMDVEKWSKLMRLTRRGIILHKWSLWLSQVLVHQILVYHCMFQIDVHNQTKSKKLLLKAPFVVYWDRYVSWNGLSFLHTFIRLMYMYYFIKHTLRIWYPAIIKTELTSGCNRRTLSYWRFVKMSHSHHHKSLLISEQIDQRVHLSRETRK